MPTAVDIFDIFRKYAADKGTRPSEILSALGDEELRDVAKSAGIKGVEEMTRERLLHDIVNKGVAESMAVEPGRHFNPVFSETGELEYAPQREPAPFAKNFQEVDPLAELTGPRETRLSRPARGVVERAGTAEGTAASTARYEARGLRMSRAAMRTAPLALPAPTTHATDYTSGWRTGAMPETFPPTTKINPGMPGYSFATEGAGGATAAGVVSGGLRGAPQTAVGRLGIRGARLLRNPLVRGAGKALGVVGAALLVKDVLEGTVGREEERRTEQAQRGLELLDRVQQQQEENQLRFENRTMRGTQEVERELGNRQAMVRAGRGEVALTEMLRGEQANLERIAAREPPGPLETTALIQKLL